MRIRLVERRYSSSRRTRYDSIYTISTNQQAVIGLRVAVCSCKYASTHARTLARQPQIRRHRSSGTELIVLDSGGVSEAAVSPIPLQHELNAWVKRAHPAPSSR
uniref:Transposase n=1 Tax=Mesocestoides corti TaxID=53468 RepID=A0A5K3FMX8_MESCO